MLESLQTDRIHVTNLVLTSAPRPKDTFDPSSFLNTNDQKELARMCQFYRQRVFSNERHFGDFNRSILVASVLDPQGLEHHQKPDNPLWSKMKSELTFVLSHNLFGGSNWEDNLAHVASIKVLFPEKKAELSLNDEIGNNITNKMPALVRSISEHEDPTWAFLSAGVIFQARAPEFRESAREMMDRPNFWERMQMMVNTTRFSVAGFAQSQMIERSLLLKLLYPERTEELDLERISLPRFKAELRDPTSTSIHLHFYRSVAAAKLLYADEIQFTEKGIIAAYEKPSLEATTPNIPEVRRF